MKEQTQPKLKISQPDDKYEREADRVAQQVIQTPEKAKEETSQTETVVRRRVTGDSSESAALPIMQSTSASSGQPLDSETRAFFEPRFGHDFGQVRVHTDTQAAESARSLNAQAYTVGQNMVFAKGEYSPKTSQGRQLLAHELTHIIQQNNGRETVLQRTIKSVAAASDDGWLTVKHSDGDLYPPLP